MPNREMLINYVPGEECRIAITQNSRLDEFYQERDSNEIHVGNIYKGKVSNVEPSIQAAFVDFGLERNGFLHISDLHPMHFPGDHREETEQVGLKTPRRERPPIQRCLKRGQSLLVQVLKEGIGTKGPTLTSYLSIPGRYLVMMPYMERMGVSRKIEDDEARRESRQVLASLNPPPGFGFIIRTAGIGRPKAELKRDLSYLVRLWKAIEKRMESDEPTAELYTESDLLIRTLRDVFSSDIDRIIVDDPTAARRARDFLAIASPRASSKMYLYKDPVPLFHRFNIESQIENIHARTVPLPSGGSLVIDQAEAMVAIDVNSGKNRDNRDAETTAYKTNIEASDEICRHLRLRDLGGVIVIDMIDMMHASHRREIETRFKNNLKNDRARTQTLPLSRFGILEMTRQRMRPSVTKSTFSECPACRGEGQVKNAEVVILEAMRRLTLVAHRQDVARIDITVSPDVAFQLLNRRRAQLVSLERRTEKPIMVRVNAGGGTDFIEVVCYDTRGSALPPSAMPDWGEPTLELIESNYIPQYDEDEALIEEPPVEEYQEQPTTDEPPAEPTGADLPDQAPRGAEPVVEEQGVPARLALRGTQRVHQMQQGDEPEGGQQRRRRRRGRRGRGGDQTQQETGKPQAHAQGVGDPQPRPAVELPQGGHGGNEREPGGNGNVVVSNLHDDAPDRQDDPAHQDQPVKVPTHQPEYGGGQPSQEGQQAAGGRRRRRRRGRRGRGGAAGQGNNLGSSQNQPQQQGHHAQQQQQQQQARRPVLPAGPVSNPSKGYRNNVNPGGTQP